MSFPEVAEPSRVMCHSPGGDRFVDVLNIGAYCGQKTGLVWERFPSGGFFDWAEADNHCATLQVGGWKGCVGRMRLTPAAPRANGW